MISASMRYQEHKAKVQYIARKADRVEQVIARVYVEQVFASVYQTIHLCQDDRNIFHYTTPIRHGHISSLRSNKQMNYQ
jgi:hypothetical protein